MKFNNTQHKTSQYVVGQLIPGCERMGHGSFPEFETAGARTRGISLETTYLIWSCCLWDYSRERGVDLHHYGFALVLYGGVWQKINASKIETASDPTERIFPSFQLGIQIIYFRAN